MPNPAPTQLQLARAGTVSAEMAVVAATEGVPAGELRDDIARGFTVIPANPRHTGLHPAGIGRGLRIKVNANIGTSAAFPDSAREVAKLRAAIEAGADAVMDLSTGDSAQVDITRRLVIAGSPVPVGTVPIYQAGLEALEGRGAIVEMSADDIFKVIERHAADGVDFATVHCGVTLAALGALRSSGRVTGVVSRGGAFLVAWMLHHGRENPLFEQYDRLLEVARRYDLTLSLGDGFRPGSIADATDAAQLTELTVLGGLVQRAWSAGVQVMVEGPGHIPLDQVEANVRVAKAVCHGAPFYVLGPLVTDVSPGYDHISAAIGGAVAGWAGADFLCYVTPAEHLGLPEADHVREGIVAARIAAHAADIARGRPDALSRDREMSAARKALDWEAQLRLAIDPSRARSLRSALNPAETEACSMCGPLCAMKIVSEALGTKPAPC
jgi:phosphomethylpyrimidine synthase